jgi:RNA polymerase sigma-70 factor (ECF subfamily)
MAEEQRFRQLMDLLQAGDQDTAAVVVNRYARRLIGLAAARLPAPVRTKEDPEDAVQSAFKSFFARQKKGEFQPEDWDELSTLLTYLTVCKVDRRIRKYLADKRDVRRESTPTVCDDVESSHWDAAAPDPTPAETAMMTDTLRELMAKLTPPDQDVLALRLQGYTAAEIASTVGRSERTVFRVLDAIRDHLRHKLNLDGDKKE